MGINGAKTFSLPLMYSVIALPLLGAIGGCTTMPRTAITEPIRIDKSETSETGFRTQGAAAGRNELITESGLTTPSGRSAAAPIISTQPPSLSGESISINFEGVGLPSFINTVFGDLLKVTFEIDSAIMAREQLVTLRTAEPLQPDGFYQLVTQVLGNYGVSVAYQNNVYRIVENAQAQREIPRIIRSRAFTNVPGDMRPVFYYATINNIRVKTMEVWIGLALRNRLDVVNVPYSNALLLLGNAQDVSAAIDVIDILDQPNLAGNSSIKISPAFWSARKLTEQLIQVLRAEGYSIAAGPESDAPIKLITVEALNTIIVFASSKQNLQHVVDWASELDQPGQTINTTGVFYHQVKNTNAEELATIVRALVSEQPNLDNEGDQREERSEARVVVDAARNAIIFRGSAEEYAQFRSLIEQMDRAPYEVMIEATVAEVTLDQGESLGIVLNFDNSVTAASNRTTIQSDNGLIVNLIQDRGDFTAALNAAADRNQVSILSSPRLIAASGKTASMQVGTQVPIITTQQTAPDGSIGGTSNILQQVQYRNTGVVLKISPIVNSANRVELTISQEVSGAQANDTSAIQSPIILTRSIETTLSVDDGETVMLAGLISENYSTGETGVPFLKDIPILGSLFKSSSRAVQKTELIVLLTPYIIDSRDTSRLIRDAFREKLSGLKDSFEYAE